MILILASIAGLASHLLYFIHGEHHMNAPRYLLAYIALFFTIQSYEVRFHGRPYIQATQWAATVFTAYSFTLFGSMVVYRTCFHRLRSFPGPRLARVSKLWHVYQARHSQNHLLMNRLHEEYGPFVRTGV